MSQDQKVIRRQKLRWRIRTKLHGTAQKPRLSVFRSNTEIYAQLIDDNNGVTLAAASSREKDIASLKVKRKLLEVEVAANKVEKSNAVGKSLAQKAKALGIEACVFDRGGYLYHGRVKSVADGAREGGLKF